MVLAARSEARPAPLVRAGFRVTGDKGRCPERRLYWDPGPGEHHLLARSFFADLGINKTAQPPHEQCRPRGSGAARGPPRRPRAPASRCAAGRRQLAVPRSTLRKWVLALPPARGRRAADIPGALRALRQGAPEWTCRHDEKAEAIFRGAGDYGTPRAERRPIAGRRRGRRTMASRPAAVLFDLCSTTCATRPVQDGTRTV